MITTLSFGQVHVKGYTKKNGTYVQPYIRSTPDKNPYNNYSYPGNTNPYTGKVATGNPETYLNRYYSKNDIIPVNLRVYDQHIVPNGYIYYVNTIKNVSTYYNYNSNDVYIGSTITFTDGYYYVFDNRGYIIDQYYPHIQ